MAVTDEDLSDLPLPMAMAMAMAIEIASFVLLESIDPIRIGKGYYLASDGAVVAKPYKLLVQAPGRSARVAIAMYAWSGRARLGLLRVKDDAIVLHVMRWPDEVRAPSVADPPTAELADDESKGVLALMDTTVVDDLTGPSFRDHYTEALSEFIQAKRADKPLPEALEPEEPEQGLGLWPRRRSPFEARLTGPVTTRKVIADRAPTQEDSEAPETNSVYQAIVNAFNQHPDQDFRARELHEVLGMPTDEASVNVTRARLGRLLCQGFLAQPGEVATRNGLNVH